MFLRPPQLGFKDPPHAIYESLGNLVQVYVTLCASFINIASKANEFFTYAINESAITSLTLNY